MADLGVHAARRRPRGWLAGALVARQVFRHKTLKQPFRTIFWVTVVANCGALAWFVVEAPLTLP